MNTPVIVTCINEDTSKQLKVFDATQVYYTMEQHPTFTRIYFTTPDKVNNGLQGNNYWDVVEPIEEIMVYLTKAYSVEKVEFNQD